MKRITATQRIICTMRSAGSHWATIYIPHFRVCLSVVGVIIPYSVGYVEMLQTGDYIPLTSQHEPSHDRLDTRRQNVAGCSGQANSWQRGRYAIVMLRNVARMPGRCMLPVRSTTF